MTKPSPRPRKIKKIPHRIDWRRCSYSIDLSRKKLKTNGDRPIDRLIELWVKLQRA